MKFLRLRTAPSGSDILARLGFRLTRNTMTSIGEFLPASYVDNGRGMPRPYSPEIADLVGAGHARMFGKSENSR